MEEAEKPVKEEVVAEEASEKGGFMQLSPEKVPQAGVEPAKAVLPRSLKFDD